MERILVQTATLTLCLIAALVLNADGKPNAQPWQTDFTEFLSMLKNADRAKLDGLRKHLLKKEIRWQGTLKYFHNGRPYIRESFVRIGDDTKAARVMYYVSPEDSTPWQQAKPNNKVTYTGIVSAVKTASVGDQQAFIYIELRQVALQPQAPK